jgi:curved DNA-binding protein CbpA
MATLYEILGLSKNATPAQVEQGFLLQSEQITNSEPSSEKTRLRLQAIREAYDILSSPTRRAAYDHKLNKVGQVTYEVVDAAPVPWMKILIGVAVLAVVVFIYQQRSASNARREALVQQAITAKAEAERAAQEAEAEKSRLAQNILAEKTQADDKRAREMEQARRDGEQIHMQLEQEHQRDAYRRNQEKEMERRERQNAAYDKAREEQAARQRVDQQTAALRRALALKVRTPD